MLTFLPVNLELIGLIFLTASTPLSAGPHAVTVEKVSFEHVEYSADSTQVVARAADGTVYVHDAATGAVVGTAYAGRRHTASAGVPRAFSADRTIVVTGDRDRIVRVRHADTGAIVAEFEGHLGEITSVAISPDGAQIVSVGDDGMGLFWPMP